MRRTMSNFDRDLNLWLYSCYLFISLWVLSRSTSESKNIYEAFQHREDHERFVGMSCSTNFLRLEGLWTNFHEAKRSDPSLSIFSGLQRPEREPIIQMKQQLKAFRAMIALVILKDAVNSSVGSDGYNGFFYISHWEIIKHYLYEAILEFFAWFDMPKSWTSTMIVHIPNVDYPKEFAQYRPSSLCNSSKKSFQRFFPPGLPKFFKKIISPKQSGFIKGTLMQGLSINKKLRSSNVAIKLDMNKAYDKLDFSNHGHKEVWFQWIMDIYDKEGNFKLWFSVVINSQSCGYFKSNIGLQQRDPISSSLFLMATEVLSRRLNNLHHQYGYLSYHR